jgi:hypothetical protein
MRNRPRRGLRSIGSDVHVSSLALATGLKQRRVAAQKLGRTSRSSLSGRRFLMQRNLTLTGSQTDRNVMSMPPMISANDIANLDTRDDRFVLIVCG